MSSSIKEQQPKSASMSEVFEEGQEQIHSSQNNIGIWEQQEQKKYIIFVDFYSREFKSKHLRRFNKIFKTMSIFVKTRDAIQCRSHHMKQLKTFRNLKSIIKNFKRKTGEQEYRKAYESAILDAQIFREEKCESLPEQLKKRGCVEKKDVGIQVKIEKVESVEAEHGNYTQPQLIQSPEFYTIPCMMPNAWQMYPQFRLI